MNHLLLDSGTELNFKKIVLLLRILITETVIFSKEFQQMNKNKKPESLKDWEPVLEQIEQIEDLQQHLPRYSSNHIRNVWKWSKNRKKFLKYVQVWKEKQINMSNPQTALKFKLTELKGVLDNIHDLEREIEEISVKVNQNEVSNLKQEIFGSKRINFARRGEKHSKYN